MIRRDYMGHQASNKAVGSVERWESVSCWLAAVSTGGCCFHVALVTRDDTDSPKAEWLCRKQYKRDMLTNCCEGVLV